MRISVLLVSIVTVCLIVVGLGILGIRWVQFEPKSINFPLQEQWQFEAEEEIFSSPVVRGDYVALRTNHKLYVLYAETGKLAWETSFQYKPGSISNPLIEKNIIIVSHPDGVTAFDLKTGKVLWSATDNPLRPSSYLAAATDEVVVIVRGYIAVRNLHTGELLWKILRISDRAAPIAVVDNSLLHLISRYQVNTYELKSGQLIHTQTEFAERWYLDGWLFSDGIFYLRRWRGSEGVFAYAMNKNEIIWSRDDLMPSVHPMVRHKEKLLVGTRNSAPVALDIASGATIWRASGVIADWYQAPLVVGDVVYIRTLTKKRLYALNLNDGSLIGYLDRGRSSPVASVTESLGPVNYDGLIIYAVDNYLYAYGE